MSPEEQRIAIAEACGWKQRYSDEQWVKGSATQATPPDYCNSLDAMHEAEKVLTDDQQRSFRDYLLTITTNLTAWSDFDMGDDLQLMIDATASQRAEAFLKTIGKWKDGGEK